MVTRPLKVERRTVSVRRPKTGVPPTVLRNQKLVVNLLFVLVEFFSLGVTAEALRANADWKSALLNGVGQLR